MSELKNLILTSQLEEGEQKNLLDKFGSFESVASEWEEKAKAIVVTREDQITEMKMAGEARKKFKQMRLDIEKARKAMKEQSLRKGQAIDAIAKYLQSLIVPIEEHLKNQEDFLKIQAEKKRRELEEKARIEEEKRQEEQRQKEELYSNRRYELNKYSDFIELSALTIETTEEEYNKLLADGKSKKEEREKERERMRKENEKLKKEAEEKEIQRQKEKQKIENEKRKAEEELMKIKREQEEKEQKQREKEEKERKEKEEAEKNEKYQKWLSDNSYNEKNMKITTDGNKYALWKLVSVLEL